MAIREFSARTKSPCGLAMKCGMPMEEEIIVNHITVVRTCNEPSLPFQRSCLCFHSEAHFSRSIARSSVFIIRTDKEIFIAD